MQRTQFTFYDSFAKAISRIKKKADKADAYDAIINYALYGIEPDLDKLPETAAMAFEMAKPNLDASRRKAENGKRGGTAKHNEAGDKQIESKPKANGSKSKAKSKQEKDKEQVKEQEKEKVKVKDKEQMLISPLSPFTNRSPLLTSAFEEWLQYKKERKDKYTETGLRNLIAQIERKADAYGDEAVADVIRLSMANGWQGIIFDRLQEKNKGTGFATGNPFLEMLNEERGR